MFMVLNLQTVISLQNRQLAFHWASDLYLSYNRNYQYNCTNLAGLWLCGPATSKSSSVSEPERLNLPADCGTDAEQAEV